MNVFHQRLGRLTRWTVMLPCVCTVPLLVAVGLIITTGVMHLKRPLEFDESYNLQVVQNLLGNRGYSTNGAVRGFGPWPFDPNITTGPAVLLPIWALAALLGDVLVAARITMGLYFALFLVVLRTLAGKGLTGWLGYGLALLLAAPQIPAVSPLLVLGEIPALALLLLAAQAGRKQRPLLMGVLLGLVVESKMSFLTASAAVAAGWCLAGAVSPEMRLLQLTRRALHLLLGYMLPIAVFELYRFVSLGGIQQYSGSIESLRAFLGSQVLAHWLEPGLLGGEGGLAGESHHGTSLDSDRGRMCILVHDGTVCTLGCGRFQRCEEAGCPGERDILRMGGAAGTGAGRCGFAGFLVVDFHFALASPGSASVVDCRATPDDCRG
jgi:hypothetical protein